MKIAILTRSVRMICRFLHSESEDYTGCSVDITLERDEDCSPHAEREDYTGVRITLEPDGFFTRSVKTTLAWYNGAVPSKKPPRNVAVHCRSHLVALFACAAFAVVAQAVSTR